MNTEEDEQYLDFESAMPIWLAYVCKSGECNSCSSKLGCLTNPNYKLQQQMAKFINEQARTLDNA